MDSAKDRWNSASAHVTSGTKRIRDVPARVRKALPREAPGSTAYTQTVWMSPDESEGQNGFDELRKYIKQGNEFCKDVSAIMQERSEIEGNYGKALAKLGGKLGKVSGGCLGTLASAWSLVATEMEAEAEIHRQLSQALHDDLYKPIKNLVDTQNKSRKPIENLVDKALKTYSDRRGEEGRCKKIAFLNAKEREKLIVVVQNSKEGRGKVMSDKDIGKMEKKIRQFEDAVRKADKEYHENCMKAEATRQDWEAAIFKASGQLQVIEEERINNMQDLLNKYNSHQSMIGPKLVQSCEKVGEAVLSVDTHSDIRKIVEQKGTGPHQPDQILPDYFAEDLSNAMDRERRRQALQNYLIYLQQDIDREVKGKEGVEKLVEVYQNQPNLGDAAVQEEARQRLFNVSSTLNYLDASRFKISTSLAELEGQTKPSSKFAQHIEKTKDKQGQVCSVLRLPTSMLNDGFTTTAGRPPADGGYVDAPYWRQESFNSHPGQQAPLQSQSSVRSQQSYNNHQAQSQQSYHTQPSNQSQTSYQSQTSSESRRSLKMHHSPPPPVHPQPPADDQPQPSLQTVDNGSYFTLHSAHAAVYCPDHTPGPPVDRRVHRPSTSSARRLTRFSRASSSSFTVETTRRTSIKTRSAPVPPNYRKSLHRMPSMQSHTSWGDEDEFDDAPNSPMGQCRAIYDYVGQQVDELTITAGDMITIYQKNDDGWWHGELRGHYGMFPATYVEEAEPC